MAAPLNLAAQRPSSTRDPNFDEDGYCFEHCERACPLCAPLWKDELVTCMGQAVSAAHFPGLAKILMKMHGKFMGGG